MKSLIQWTKQDGVDIRGQIRRGCYGYVKGDYFINIYQMDDKRYAFSIRSKNHWWNTVLSGGEYYDLRHIKLDAAKWGFINLFLQLNKQFVEKSGDDIYGENKASYYTVRRK